MTNPNNNARGSKTIRESFAESAMIGLLASSRSVRNLHAVAVWHADQLVLALNASVEPKPASSPADLCDLDGAGSPLADEEGKRL